MFYVYRCTEAAFIKFLNIYEDCEIAIVKV